MMRNRLIEPPRKSRVPEGPREWQQLMLQVLTRLEKLGQNATTLRNLYATNQSEAYLRKRGIICPTDIDREFPLP